MAKKITYLLGAGASANTIPIAAQMHARMIEIHKYLSELKRIVDSAYLDPARRVHIKIEQNRETLNKIISDLDWLITEAGNYYTIDTLAKKLYLLKDISNLNKLKACLIIYFTLEQYVFIESKPILKYNFDKNKIDKRYGSFIASIANIKTEPSEQAAKKVTDDWIGIELNPDIRILSWNYDVQFELNLARLFLGKKIHFLQKSFQILPNETTISEDQPLKIQNNQFVMVKMNGNAIWDMAEEFQPLKYTATVFDYNTEVKDDGELLGYFLEKLSKVSSGDSLNKSVSFFNFAWENDVNFKDKYKGHEKNLELAEKIAAKTEILVVIGYSFPIFNREFDNKLFKNMYRLKKVYVQDLDPESIQSTMENAFEVFQQKKRTIDGSLVKEIPTITFHLTKNTNQFVIPYELNQ